MGFRQQNKTNQNKHGKKDLLIMMIVAIIIIAIKKRLLTIIAKITVIKIVVGHQS